MFGLTGIMGAGLAIAIAFGGYQYQRAERYQVERDTAIGNTQVLKGEIQAQNSRIEGYVAKVATDQIQIRFHEDAKNKAEAERDRQLSDINAWRTKLDAEIEKRPAVAARAAGMATRRVFIALEAASTSGGGDGGDSSPTVLPSTPSAGNSPSD